MQLLTMGVSAIDTDLVEQVKGSWEGDKHLQQLIQQLSADQTHRKYSWAQGPLHRKAKLVVGNMASLG